MGIQSIEIKNYKSIRHGKIDIKPMNVLIGPNGAGKSNFVSFFKFLNKLYEQQLQLYINQHGRADNMLYFGRKQSDNLYGKITFDNDWQNEYEFALVPDSNNNLIFSKENSNTIAPDTQHTNYYSISPGGNMESMLHNYDSFTAILGLE